MADDGLEDVLLSKPWLDNDPGSIVRVDPERAARMRSDGVGKRPPKKPRVRKEDVEVTNA